MTDFPKNLAKALLKVQSELRGVVKDSTNPHFKNRYASLEGVIDTIKPVLQKNGIVFLQAPGAFENGAAQITTTFIHAESGEQFSSTIGLPVAKQDPQGIGSAITYACRYSLMAMLGLPPVDDDAEDASKETKPHILAEPKATAAQNKLIENIKGCITPDELDKYIRSDDFKNIVGMLPEKHRGHVRTAYQTRFPKDEAA